MLVQPVSTCIVSIVNQCQLREFPLLSELGHSCDPLSTIEVALQQAGSLRTIKAGQLTAQ